MAKIIVGMSGGVDSAVAAYLLKKAGHDVIGVTLRTWASEDGAMSRCCEIDDARSTARKLQIPFYAWNCAEAFYERVIDSFVCAYREGMTPNPCTICNRAVKWEWLLHIAQVLQADQVATGHYASVVRLENGRYTLRKATQDAKDQSYMLHLLSQEQLARTVLPLGELTKDEVRCIARQAELPVAQKRDSQEICFVTEGRYADFIAERMDGAPQGGCFVHENGEIIGQHKGIVHYTVGQRKGLGLALGYPAYVQRIDAQTRQITISGESGLYRTEICCDKLNFLSIPVPESGKAFRALVKIRYHHNGQFATVEKSGADSVRIVFDRPVRAPAPGQAAVFYDGAGCVIGGGRILPEK